MRKLNTIQKRNNLNTVYAVDEKGIRVEDRAERGVLGTSNK